MGAFSICNGKSCWIDTYDVAVTNPSGGIVQFDLTDGCNILTRNRQLKMVLAKAINNWITANRSALDTAGYTTLLGSCDAVNCDCGVGHTLVEWNFGNKRAVIDFGSLPAGVSVDVTVVAEQPFAKP